MPRLPKERCAEHEECDLTLLSHLPHLFYLANELVETHKIRIRRGYKDVANIAVRFPEERIGKGTREWSTKMGKIW